MKKLVVHISWISLLCIGCIVAAVATRPLKSHHAERERNAIVLQKR